MGCFAAIVTASLGFEFRKHPRKLGSGSAATNTHTQYFRSVLPDDRSKKGDIASFKGGKEHEVENLRRVEVIQSHDYDRKQSFARLPWRSWDAFSFTSPKCLLLSVIRCYRQLSHGKRE